MHFSPAKTEKETGAKSPCVEQKKLKQIMCLQNLISFTIQFNCFINHRTVPSCYLTEVHTEFIPIKDSKVVSPSAMFHWCWTLNSPSHRLSRVRKACVSIMQYEVAIYVRLESFHKVETERIGQINVRWLKLKWLLYLRFSILNKSDY